MALGPGSRVRLVSSGAVYDVGAPLGEGGQGSVHRVTPHDGEGPLALKWYRPGATTTRQLHRLRRLLTLPAPNTDFLWPIDLARSSEDDGFGYVMPLRAEGRVALVRVLNGAASIDLRASCTAALRLADGFLRLHARGLHYADISLGNLFVDPSTGDVQICDNDNVAVDGDPSDVLGTPYFMAPEVVRGETGPSSATDRHSLAVILFLLLVRHHPLLGAREERTAALDAASMSRLLGADPVFVFDPDDETNRPLAASSRNARILWPILPASVQRLFVGAFTAGLDDPRHARVTETVWRAAMTRLRGLVRSCPACGAEQFFDPERPERACGAPDCGAVLGPPLRLEGRHPLVLEPGASLRRSDLTNADPSNDAVLGEVVTHPGTGAIALLNTSADPWTLRRGAAPSTVPPRAAFVARAGARLTVDAAEATLEA